MKFVYFCTVGSSDPTAASIPLHLALNGSVEVGHETSIVLGGDATELIVGDAAETIEGLGVPPMRELLAKAKEKQVPVYIWKACAVARGATDDNLKELGASWVTPPDVAKMMGEADKVLTF